MCSLLFFCGLGPILGIIFGFIARAQIRRDHQAGDGLAMAGIIVGFAFTALWVVYIVVLIVVAHHCGTDQYGNNVCN